MKNIFSKLFSRSSSQEPEDNTAALDNKTFAKKAKKASKFSRKDILIYGIFPFSAVDINPTTGEISPITVPPVAYVATSDQAFEVVDRLVYMNHFEHYKMWCGLRSLPVGFLEDSWAEYANNLIATDGLTDSDKFRVLELRYSQNDITAFLRMFCDCPPLLLPYENTEELRYYINSTITSTDHDNPGIPEHLQRLIDTNIESISTKLVELIHATIDINIEKAKEEEENKK